MKKKIIAALTYPAILLIGWLGTRLSESYADSLATLEVDFDEED